MDRLLVLACLTACVTYDDTTHVLVRDPRAVTATIRPYEPGYDHSWIERSIDGAIDVWCPDCNRYIKRQTYTSGRDIAVNGTPADHLQVDGDQVTLRVDFDDLYRCGPQRGRHIPTCSKPALAVELVTPRTNVESIRYDHLYSPTNGGHGTSMIAVGSAWCAIGVLLAVLGIHEREGALIGTGIAMVGGGVPLGGYGIYLARGHDTVTNIAP